MDILDIRFPPAVGRDRRRTPDWTPSIAVPPAAHVLHPGNPDMRAGLGRPYAYTVG